MALITLSEAPDAPIDGFDETKLQANTATGFISTVFSSSDRVTGPANAPQDFDINDLDFSGTAPYQKRRPSRGFLRGRRPYFGLLFPRGYYNR